LFVLTIYNFDWVQIERRLHWRHRQMIDGIGRIESYFWKIWCRRWNYLKSVADCGVEEYQDFNRNSLVHLPGLENCC